LRPHQIFTGQELNDCMKSKRSDSLKACRVTALVVLLLTSLSSYSYAQTATRSEVQTAVDLYNQRRYAQAADAFERVIRTSPGARVCYYAALANRASGRELRARQLFQYVADTYPKSPEAALAKNGLPAVARSAIGSQPANSQQLPEIIRSSLPPEMQALLNTEQGKRAVEQALKEHAQEAEAIKLAEKENRLDREAVANAVRNTAANASPIRKQAPHPEANHPFTAEDIARDGAEGIDQSRFPNCWFEASMSALAQLPRGQRLLASMIQRRDKDAYTVRFPNDGVEYVIPSSELDRSGIHDRSLWASIIEAAELKKFPDNHGAEGSDGDQSRLEVGLGCITGCKAEVIHPANCGEAELSSFIGAAIKSGNPVVAATWGEYQLNSLPPLVFPSHAYTIIGLDQAKNMILLRNPHGRGAKVFQSLDDPNHLEFEQLENGKFKMSIEKFQKYFHSIARSFI